MFEHSTFSSKPNWTSASGPPEIVVLDSDQWPLTTLRLFGGEVQCATCERIRDDNMK